MALTCSRCSRVNPPDAVYCYFDGMVLSGQAGTGPLNMATLPFPMPFVFPSGRMCQNFDQLALACHEESKAAAELLTQGDLAGFLGSVGRGDLARLAREAAKAPDVHRGLDELLAKFPGNVLKPPKLFVEPTEINLGELKLGEDRTFNVNLINQGMRLVYGTIRSSEHFLVVGDAGAAQKLFEFNTELSVPIALRGKRLVARPKPYEAKLTVDSSGGRSEVIVRFKIAVKPFPQGVLVGAVSPRQIAEKAKANPKDAAPFFENGTVARWYQQNGWEYPVKGPATSGLAAIQQYFEAHGLAKAPKVGISQNQVVLMGTPGEILRHQLEVRTQEKRSVYALASSSHPWLVIESTPPRGQVAPVSLVITVPDHPGETINARVVIRANGNQLFNVPVVVQVGAGKSAGRAVGAAVGAGVGTAAAAAPVYALADAPASSRAQHAAAPITAQQPLSTPAALPRSRARDDDGDLDDWRPRPKRKGGIGLRHLVPAVLLLLPVFGFFVHDVFVKALEDKDSVKIVEPPEEKFDPTPRIALRMQDNGADHGYPRAVDPMGQLGTTMRFGLIMTQELMPDPKNPQQKAYKRLTYMERGLTNNTVVRVDGSEAIFGQVPGRWTDTRLPLPKDSTGREPDGARSIWALNNDKIAFNQIVEVVPGQAGLLDTCLVKYVVENRDAVPHRIGLRFMLDTYIGANDGVPFAIPGVKGLCDTLYEFKTPQEVPDFIQACEHSDLNNPGTVALVQFRVGRNLEPPARVTLGAWPNPKIGDAKYGANAQNNKDNHFRQFMTMWDVPLLSMQTMRQIDNNASADSCVVMYWPEQDLKPGDNRLVGFSYGLGVVGAAKEGKLGVSVGGSTELGGEFSITAMITNPTPGQTVTVHLPEELELIEGEPKQIVPAVPDGSTLPVSTVTWKVRSKKEGTHVIGVESGQSKASIKIRIRKPEQKGIFD